MKFKYTFTCPHCRFEMTGDFTPERPAPVCSNHDSPAFSDSGDTAEWDGPEECLICGKDINVGILLEKAAESIERKFKYKNLEDY